MEGNSKRRNQRREMERTQALGSFTESDCLARLQTVVAELLMKNQIIRFELHEARERLRRLEQAALMNPPQSKLLNSPRGGSIALLRSSDN